MTEQPPETAVPTHKLVCPYCRSERIRQQRWVDANTDEVGESAERYSRCDACEEAGDPGEHGFEDSLYVPAHTTAEGWPLFVLAILEADQTALARLVQPQSDALEALRFVAEIFYHAHHCTGTKLPNPYLPR